MLKQRFQIEHTTLQVDHAHDPLLSITSRATTDHRSEER